MTHDPDDNSYFVDNCDLIENKVVACLRWDMILWASTTTTLRVTGQMCPHNDQSSPLLVLFTLLYQIQVYQTAWLIPLVLFLQMAFTGQSGSLP